MGWGRECQPAVKIEGGITSTTHQAVSAAVAHKYGDFAFNKILYNQRGLMRTLTFP